jgi:hypothetical protein
VQARNGCVETHATETPFARDLLQAPATPLQHPGQETPGITRAADAARD